MSPWRERTGPRIATAAPGCVYAAVVDPPCSLPVVSKWTSVCPMKERHSPGSGERWRWARVRPSSGGSPSRSWAGPPSHCSVWRSCCACWVFAESRRRYANRRPLWIGWNLLEPGRADLRRHSDGLARLTGRTFYDELTRVDRRYAECFRSARSSAGTSWLSIASTIERCTACRLARRRFALAESVESSTRACA